MPEGSDALSLTHKVTWITCAGPLGFVWIKPMNMAAWAS